MEHHPIPSLAVLGICSPERSRVAASLAAASGRELITASRLTLSPDPLAEAVNLLPWTQECGAVIEFPVQVPAPEIIGSLMDGSPDDPSPARLDGLLAVVDAAHFLTDLHRTDVIDHHTAVHGVLVPASSARSLLMVEQIELASAVCLVNWRGMAEEERTRIRAIISHLAPTAPIFDDDGPACVSWLERTAAAPQSGGVELTRPGWVCRLNGHHHCRHTCPEVETMIYSQPRPLHPVRLRGVLDDEIEPGVHGMVLRSSGFCRIATRPGITGRWSHAGKVITFEPAGVDGAEELGGLPLSWGQELVLTGVGLDVDGLRSALDRAVLTDAELLAGPQLWSTLPDPFPAWSEALP